MAIVPSGRPSASYGSTSRLQSIRFSASHCLSLPFWYRARSFSRLSSYSQLNLVDPVASTFQLSADGKTYISLVDIPRALPTTSYVHRTYVTTVARTMYVVKGWHGGGKGQMAGPLSRELIVRTALSLIERDGAAAASMRRLA